MTDVVFVEALMLDLDGTLLDHRTASDMAVLASCRLWFPDVELPEAQVRRRWSDLERDYMELYLRGEVTFQEQRRARLRGLAAMVGAPRFITDTDADRGFAIYVRNYEHSWIAYPDVRDAIEWMQQSPRGLAVLSNGERTQQVAKLRAIGMPREVPLFVPSDVGAAKPAPASFLGVCSAQGWQPSLVAYVGDNIETDAVAAARAGLVGIWLDRDGSAAEAQDGEIRRATNLVELQTILAWHSGSRDVPQR